MTELIHSFHIPVMGTAFTIESPLKVARYGISSVISLVDDSLIEKMRRFYCRVMGQECTPIRKHDDDSRANRVTAYLNLLDEAVKEQFEKLKASAFEVGTEITKYFELLPDHSSLKSLYKAMLSIRDSVEKYRIQEELRKKIKPGTIDVNIMTKVDHPGFDRIGAPLPSEFSDALAALRGYARSRVESSIVFSAGFNGRLYGYTEHFDDFHADENGRIKKKIVIKVNDYRSALTQGKFFAKKGLWVSEFRLESGLNCGGHAFAHGGSLMGPSLEEFKNRKDELIATLFEIYNRALRQKKKRTFDRPHPLRITAQGGIGTANEHNFILRHYGMDAAGWGTPFLLVPEATTVDAATLKKLCDAGRDDLFLSDVSPLGVPFNNLRTSPSEEAKLERIRTGKPGSPCTKGYLKSNTEFTEMAICVASRAYQERKIKQILDENGGDMEASRAAIEAVTAKSCLCTDLGGTALLAHDLVESQDVPCAPAICPGPGLAYFTKPVSLKDMVDHIYGRTDIIENSTRPNLFISELEMDIDYFEKELLQALPQPNEQTAKYLREFEATLREGIVYYRDIVPLWIDETPEYRARMNRDLGRCLERLQQVVSRYQDTPALELGSCLECGRETAV
jgi:hypothetical protein